MLTDDGRQEKLQSKTQADGGVKKVRDREGIRLEAERTAVPCAWDSLDSRAESPISQETSQFQANWDRSL